MSLPEELHVEGDLMFLNCANLISLPERLHVRGNLDIFDCTSLISLPERLHVEGNLFLSNCTSLTSLPEGLFVGEGLILADCIRLILPERLHVRGNLDIRRCNSMTSLQEGLHVEGNFYFRECTSLTSLPERLHMGGDLDLRGCASLTSLPSWITTLGPLPNGRTRTVNLENTGLTENILARLREAVAPGVRFNFSHAASKPLQTFKTLDVAFKFWEIEPRPVIDLEGQVLGSILTFLSRLTTTPEYQNLLSRPRLKQRLVEAFNLMVSNDEMKDLVVTIITHGLISCDDRLISALDEIELVVQLPQVGDSEAELRKLGRGMLLLEMVDKEAQKHAQTLSWVDEIEISLAFRIGLTQKLGLPLSTQNMRFRNCAQITDEQILATGDVILQKCRDECVDAYLKTWGPWMKYQRSLFVTPYEMLPVAEEQLGREQEKCPILLCIPQEPVLYNKQIYDYDAFVRVYIDTGINPITREHIIWGELQRLGPKLL